MSHLSKRAKILCEDEEFMVGKMCQCASNLFNAKTNPTGFLNCGTADNLLCVKELHDWMVDNGVSSCFAFPLAPIKLLLNDAISILV